MTRSRKGPLGVPRPLGVTPLASYRPLTDSPTVKHRLSVSKVQRRVEDKWAGLRDAGVVTDLRYTDGDSFITVGWDTPNTDVGSGLVVNLNDESASVEVRLPPVSEDDRDALLSEWRTLKRGLRDEIPIPCGGARLKFNDIRNFDGLRPHVTTSCRRWSATVRWAGILMRELDDQGLFNDPPV